MCYGAVFGTSNGATAIHTKTALRSKMTFLYFVEEETFSEIFPVFPIQVQMLYMCTNFSSYFAEQKLAFFPIYRVLKVEIEQRYNVFLHPNYFLVRCQSFARITLSVGKLRI